MATKSKYPRTYHLPFSPGATSDDKVQRDLSSLVGREVIVTEKMDGENTTITSSSCYARSTDSLAHESRNWVRGLWGSIRHDIPEGMRLCGENLYARHAIAYRALPSYFMLFSVWDGDTCLSWDSANGWAEMLGLVTVPVLYRGAFDTPVIKRLCDGLDTTRSEGCVVRLASSFDTTMFSRVVLKWVRAGHVQDEKHWSKKKVVPNGTAL